MAGIGQANARATGGDAVSAGHEQKFTKIPVSCYFNRATKPALKTCPLMGAFMRSLYQARCPSRSC